MLNNIKRIFSKIVRNTKQCPEIEIPGISNKIIKNTVMTRNDVVVAGHYCSTLTISSESKDIIRVLGPDKKRNNYYIIDGGKSMNGDTILDEYVLLDTKPNLDRDKKLTIFSDFEPINVAPKKNQPVFIEEEGFEDDEDYHYEPGENESVEPDIPVFKTKIKPKAPVVEIDKYADIRKLLEKAHVDSLNKNYNEKYGTSPYSVTIVPVTVNVQIPYDINKLNQISELFDIQTNELVDFLLSKVELPKQQLAQEITETLSKQNIPTSQKPVVKEPETKSQVVIEVPSTKNIHQEDVESGISEIDSYLNSLFNKK